MEPIRFRKLEGCGNSFVVVSDQGNSSIDWASLSKAVCRPSIGIGSDGLLVVMPSRQFHFEVQMYNPDGSAMGMCGNGIRCVARYLFLENLIAVDRNIIEFGVENRKIVCHLQQQARVVEVDMGVPLFDPAQIPLNVTHEFIEQTLGVLDKEFEATALSMGNPHCVIFVDDLDSLEFGTLGPAIEVHPHFPRRTNVEFVQVRTRDCLRVKVWERGAGPTLACGTGACAALVAAVRTGRTEPHAEVILPGGSLHVRWDKNSSHVFLTGPAQEICQGSLSQEFLKRAFLEHNISC